MITARRKNILRIALILAAVLFIILGVFREEANVVLAKAKAICFACIGLN